MAVSKTHTGWRRDKNNSRLDYYYEGSRIGHIDASGLTVAAGFEILGDLDDDSVDSEHYIADSIDKEHLASEIYQIVPVCFSGESVDNQTITGVYKCWSAATVVRVCYFTDGTLGTGLGIDVVDGGTNGSGSDVIDSCSDNLDGSDINDLTTPYALSAGDYINIVFDDVTNGRFISVIILLKVPLGAAT